MAGSGQTSFRDQVDTALHGLPGLKGLSPDKDAISPISGSGSNFIYRVKAVTDAGQTQELCLRKPNLNQGGLGIEVAVLNAAYAHGISVPRVYGTATLDGIESLFYEWVPGEARGDRIVGASELAGVRDTGHLGRQCGEALARIHQLDAKALSQHLPRQPVGAQATLQNFAKKCSKLSVLRPAIHFTIKWLEAHLPLDAGEEPKVIHGDYRNGNVVVSAEKGLAAVLDWELAHLGNRYEDIGWICTPSWRFGKWDLPVGGFGSLDEFCKAYESVSGHPIDRATVDWWTLLSQVKWAVICMEMGVYFNNNNKSLEHSVIGRRTSEAEMDCLILIAEQMGGLTSLLEDKSSFDLPEPTVEDGMFPSSSMMVESVRLFLKSQVGPALTRTGDKRNAFVNAVAVNALGMVVRSMQSGPQMQQSEVASLQQLLGVQAGAIQELRDQLVGQLKSGQISIDKPGLLPHLLRFTALQLSVDQPKYPSLGMARSML